MGADDKKADFRVSVMTIRRAVENDRDQIAALTVGAFASAFKLLDKNLKLITQSIKDFIIIENFFVADQEELIGLIALSNLYSRAFELNIKSLRQNLGFMKGLIAGFFVSRELKPKRALTDTEAFIEIVAVDNRFRGRGIATQILNHIICHTRYEQYYLEVLDTNDAAIRCYKKCGFFEYSRKRESLAKNYHYKMILKYCKTILQA